MTSNVIQHLSEPSLRTGYARSASESANPGLWKGLTDAWLPSLGITADDFVPNVVRPTNPLDAGINRSWEVLPGGISYSSAASGNRNVTNTYKQPTLDRSITVLLSGFMHGTASIGANIFNMSTVSDTHDIIELRGLNSTLIQVQSFDSTDASKLFINISVDSSIVENIFTAACSIGPNEARVVIHAGGVTWEESKAVTGGSFNTSNERIDLGQYQSSSMHFSTQQAAIWNRETSWSQLHHLVSDPLAPFRLRPTVISLPAVAPPVTGTTAISIPRLSEPSLKTGYARNAGESSNPGLWRGMVGAWVPALDNQIALRNQASGVQATLGTSLTGSDKTRVDGVACINYDKTIEHCLKIPNVWNLNPLNTPTTVFQRVNFDAINNYQTCFMQDTGNTSWIAGRAASNNIYSYVNGNTTAPADGTVGQWHRICSTIAANGGSAPCQVWLDGVAGSSLLRTPTSSTDDFRIGADDGNPTWSLNGKIAETYLWRRVLTPSEIRQLSSDPLAPFRLRPIVLSIPGEAPPPPTTRRRILISMS